MTIEINDLTLTFDSRCIFHNFTAKISQGEFIGIFGPNGAGKSSLLRAILGLILPASGKITLLNNSSRRDNKHIGYVPQFHSNTVVSPLSGYARVASVISGYQWGLPILSQAQQQEVWKILTLVDAQEYAHRPFTELSGGERQRLFLAQALVNQPKILLLDEPLSNLDPNSQETLVELVQKIRRELNVTVLFTAHDLNPLLNVMDRIIYLARGNAVIGEVAEIVTSEKLSWLYGTPIEVLQHKQRLFVISLDRGAEYVPHHHNNPDDV